MPTNVGTLVARIGGDVRDLRVAFNDSQRMASQFADSMTSQLGRAVSAINNLGSNMGRITSVSADLINSSERMSRLTTDYGYRVEQASLRVATFGDKLRGVGRSIANTTKRIVPFAGAVAVAGLAVAGFRKTVTELIDATKLAARVEVMGHVLEMTGERAGYTERQIKGYQATIEGLGIATKEAIQIEQLFIQSQLDVADAAKIARAAQDLAVISGQNSSEAARTLTEAIVSQRPILLKQFGIIASLDKIYGDMAKALGKTRTALTETEKRQAFMNEIMRQATTIAGSYETAMRDVGKRITSLPRYFANAAVAVGTHFLPQMKVLVDVTANVAKKIEKLFISTEKATSQFYGARDAFDAKSKATMELADRYDELSGKARLNADEQDELKTIIQRLTAIMPAAASEWDKANRVIGVNTERIRANIEQKRALFRVEQADVIREFAKNWQDVNEELSTFEKLSAKDVPIAITVQLDWLSLLTGQGVKFKSTVDDVNESIAEQHQTLNDLEIALSQGFDAVNDYAGTHRYLAKIVGDETATKLTDAIKVLQEADIAAANAKKSTQGAADAHENLGLQLLTVSDEMEEVIGKWDELNRKADEAGANIKKQSKFVGDNILTVTVGMQDVFTEWDKSNRAMADSSGDLANAVRHNFENTFFRWFEGRVQGLRGIIEGLASNIASAMNRIASQSIAERILGAIPFFGGGGAPATQRFQHGGIVTRPTLAMVGEAGAEAIVPLGNNNTERMLSRIAASTGTGGGVSSRTINVNMPISAASPESYSQSKMQIAANMHVALVAATRNL